MRYLLKLQGALLLAQAQRLMDLLKQRKRRVRRIAELDHLRQAGGVFAPGIR